MILGDIGGVELRQDGYLLYDVFYFIFRVFNIDDLYCYRLSSTPVDTLEKLVRLMFYVSKSYSPFVYLPETATACGYVSVMDKRCCMSTLPMQFCLVYRVSGSTEPLMTVPAEAAMASPANRRLGPYYGRRT